MNRRGFLRSLVIGSAALATMPTLAKALASMPVPASPVVPPGLTNFGALTQTEMKVWSRSMWDVHRDKLFMKKFMGDRNAVIQRVAAEHGRSGARATFVLVADA